LCRIEGVGWPVASALCVEAFQGFELVLVVKKKFGSARANAGVLFCPLRALCFRHAPASVVADSGLD